MHLHLQRLLKNFNLVKKPRNEGTDESRGVWPTQCEFVQSSIGFIVGFGNIWRFPMLIVRHSGTFIFVYIIVAVFIAVPSAYLQLSVGQYSGWPAHIAFGKMAPLFSGIGWALVLSLLPLVVYYNIIVAWGVNYLAISLVNLFGEDPNRMPWATCNNSWNTDRCSTRLVDSAAFYNGSRQSAAEQYLYNHVLNRSDNIGDMGYIQWKMVASLFGVWLVTFLCVSKGIQSIGKVVYFTATFPYVGLLILLIRGLTLPGAFNGIRYYFTIEWENFYDTRIWKDAAAQAFYSLSLDRGCHVTLASYSRFHNNIYRDSILFVAVDTLTSILSGVVMMIFIGHTAFAEGLGNNLTALLKPNLDDSLFISFVAFPDALSRVPLASLWSVIYFLVICVVAVDCEFGWIEQLAGSTWGYIGGHMGLVKMRLVAVLCAALFLLGLPLCYQLPFSLPFLVAVVMTFKYITWSRSYAVRLVATMYACTAAQGLLFIVVGWLKPREEIYARICYQSYSSTDTSLSGVQYLIVSGATFLSVLLYAIIAMVGRRYYSRAIQNDRTNPGKKRKIQEQKRMTISLAVSCLFTTCLVTLPYLLASFLREHKEIISDSGYIITVLWLLTNVNPMLNLVIFVTRHAEVRKALGALWHNTDLPANLSLWTITKPTVTARREIAAAGGGVNSNAR